MTDDIADSELSWGLTVAAPIVGLRILKLTPHQILLWLQSNAFTKLKQPSVSQLIPVIKRPTVPPNGTLSEYLQLLEQVRNMESDVRVESGPDVLSTLLEVYCDPRTGSGADACLELVAAWTTPLLQEQTEITLSLLSRVLSQLFPGSSSSTWSQMKSTFAKELCDALSKHEASDSLSRLLKIAVDALLPNVRFSDQAPGLQTAFTRASSPMAVAFWIRLILRCAKRTKMLSHFDELDSLVAVLPGWHVAQPKQHMLFAFLSLLDALSRRQHTEAGVIIDTFTQLQKKSTSLFSDASVGNASMHTVQTLSASMSTLNMIETVLFPPLKVSPTWEPIVAAHQSKWSASFTIIEREVAFLDALQRDVSGIPQLVAALERQSVFRASREQAM
eukprot:4575564-Prymnesium_polylepis.1